MTELNALLGQGQDPASTQSDQQSGAAGADQHQQHQDPAQSGQIQQQAGAQAGADDEPIPDITEIEGRQMVPLEAVQAERGKRKKYTDQIASFEKQLSESNKRSEDREKFWAQRFDQMVGLLRNGQQGQQQQQQPEQQVPDFFENPEGAVGAIVNAAIEKAINPVTSHVRNVTEATSRRLAVSEHGPEAVQGAYQAIEQKLATNDPRAWAQYQAIMQSGDPWGELVNWHKRETAMAEIGNDPAAFRAKIEAEVLAKLQGSQPGQGAQPGGQQQQQQPQQRGQQQQPVMPSNLAGARNAGVRTGPAWGGPASLGDIFDRRNEAVTRG